MHKSTSVFTATPENVTALAIPAVGKGCQSGSGKLTLIDGTQELPDHRNAAADGRGIMAYDVLQRLYVMIQKQQGDVERRACAVAVNKISEALATIGVAYTCHEGIYAACLNSLLGLEDIDELPSSAKSLLRKFLGALIPEPGLAGADKIRSAIAALSQKEALQFVDDLLRLRMHLQHIYFSFYEKPRRYAL